MEISGEFVAEQALVVYRYNPGQYDEDAFLRPLDHYITLHRLDAAGRLLEGEPLTRRALSQICSLIMPSISEVEYLPHQVIAYSPDHLMWWVPGGKRTVFFSRQTDIKSGRYPVPASLMFVCDRTLHIWALAKNQRPTPDTPVFHSPFFNVHDKGMCCMGNIALPPQSCTPAQISEWETAFFNGCLTRDLPPKIKGLTPKQLWDSIYEKIRFPVQHLVPHPSETVAGILQEIGRRPREWT